MTKEERKDAINSIKAIRKRFLRGYGEDTVIDVPIDGDDMQALDRAISALSENKEEWIPISERLPEVSQNVLATTKWGEVTIAERLNFVPDCWFIHEGNTNAHTEDIVAWQPLPEPYKEGGE